MVNEIVVDISDLVPIKELNNSYYNTSTNYCLFSTKVTIMECDDFDLLTPKTECCPIQSIGSITVLNHEQLHKQQLYEQFLHEQQLHKAQLQGMQLHEQLHEQLHDDQSVTGLSEVEDVPILTYSSGLPKRELGEDIDNSMVNLDDMNIICSDDERYTPLTGIN